MFLSRSRVLILLGWLLAMPLFSPFALAVNQAPVVGFGTALEFDGADDYLEMNDFALGTGEYTLESWIRVGTKLGYLLLNRTTETTGDGNWFSLNLRADPQLAMKLGKNNGAGFSHMLGDTMLNSGEWYHLAVVKSAGTITLYVNGEIDGEFDEPAGRDVTSGEGVVARFGGWVEGNSGWFNGAADEIRVWNTARSQAQIQAAMHTHLTGAEPNLIGYWDFEETPAGTATDLSASANDATLYNMDAADWVASGISYTVLEDDVLTANLTAYDPDGDPLTFLPGAVTPSMGALTLNPDGSFSYTPNLNQNGTDSFSYKVNDGALDSAEVTVTIHIRPDHAPVAGFGAALDFDGANDYVEIPDFPDVPIGAGETATFELWMNGVSQFPLCKNSDWHTGANYEFCINIEGDGRLRFQPGNVFSTTAINDGEWHHVAIVFDGTAGTFYRDGEVDGSFTVTANAAQAVSLLIGARRENDATDINAFYQGRLDEIRIWDTARSQAQIQGEMDHPLTGSEPGLIAYWPFDEGNGTVAADASGYANDGELLNMDAADWVDSLHLKFITNPNVPLSDTLPAHDGDGDTLVHSLVSDDGGGAVLDDANTGAFTYTSAVPGVHTFTYQVNDGTEDSNVATVQVTVINLVVDNSGDTDDGNYGAGQNTLREAIANASAGDTITFAGDYTIALSDTLTIDQDLSIDAGSNSIVLVGDDSHRVFYLNSGTVNFTGFTISHGGVTAYSGADRVGAGLYIAAAADATLESMTFDNNSAQDGGTGGRNGGGISNDGTLNVNNTLFYQNKSGSCGAIHNNAGGTATVTNSLLEGNTVWWTGSGFCNGASATMTVRNITVTGGNSNDHNSYGTISNNGVLDVYNSTIAYNASGKTATIAGIKNTGTLSLYNSIIYNPDTATADCENTGTLAASVNNLIDDGTCSGTAGAPGIATALADNGATLQTLALSLSSPALNAGDNATCESTDARGVTRPTSGTVWNQCDIGAYEFEPPSPQNLVVDNVGNALDSDTSAGNNSLRDAIFYANAGDTITFDASLAGQTLLLDSQLTLDKSLTIDGGGNIGISGNHVTRVFETSLGNTFVFDGLSILDASSSQGGGIWAKGAVTVRNCVFSGNSVTGNGGAIRLNNNTGHTLVIENSSFYNNTAARGGALDNDWAGGTTIRNSTFFNNTASSEGGTIRTNTSDLTIRNSTFSNSNQNTVQVFGTKTFSATNSIFANNTDASNDCQNSATLGTVANNLIESNNGCGTPTVTTDPQLGGLLDNGGWVPTMALPLISPALDAGDNATCESTDARDIARPQNTTCDIGAYEKQPPAFTSTPITAATEDLAYAYAITTTNPDSATPPIITAPTLPAWLGFTDHGDGTATLSGTPSEAEVGSHDVLLSLNATTEDVQQAFTIQVGSVNDPPSFSASAPPPTQSGVAEQIDGWATFSPGGGPLEVGQTATYFISNISNPGAFAVAPAVSPDGVLTYQTAATASGTVDFTVTVQDSGGSSSMPQTYTLAINLSVQSLTITGTGIGQVTSPGGLSCAIQSSIASGDCELILPAGTLVNPEAAAPPGMAFAHWGGDCAGQPQSAALTLERNLVCAVEFQTDRNFDGIPDLQQPFIKNTSGVTVIVENCPACVVDSLRISDPASHAQPDTTHTFTGPLTEFQISGAPVGGALEVSIQYELNQNPAGWVYRKFGQLVPGDAGSQAWFTHPSASFSTTSWLGLPLVVAHLAFTDGQLGDDSGADGVIIDPGAPALGRGVIGFSPSAYAVAEEAGGVNLTVTRVGGTHGALAANFASEDGEALAGSDYAAVGDTLQWPEGDASSRTIRVPLLDDDVAENPESFAVVLTGADVDALTARATVTIGGSDHGIALTPNEIQLNEGESVIVTLTRDKNGDAVVVNYASQDQTATVGADYVPLGGQLAWAAGELGSREITVTTLADGMGETAETFVLLFSGGLSHTVPVTITGNSGVIGPTGSTTPPLENGGTESGSGVDLAEVPQMSASQLASLPPEAFPEISPEVLALIPPESFADLSPEQFGGLSAETLAALTPEQFAELPASAVSGLTADNLPALSIAVVGEFTTEHVDALSVEAMNEMPITASSQLMIYLDLSQVDLAQVARIVPASFDYNPETGDFLPPPGSAVMAIAAGGLGATASGSAQGITTTRVIDMSRNLSVGGQGHSPSFQNQADLAMVYDDLTKYFTLTQDKQGILQVKGSEEVGGISFAFVPDLDNVVRLEEDEEIKVGLGVDDLGFFHLTLPNGIRFQVTPAPQNYQQVNQVTGATDLYQGARGEIMLSFGDATNRRRGRTRAVGMFDPLIEPPPGEYCVEVSPDEFRCDFSRAPVQQRPGVHALSRRRDGSSDAVRIVYPDGSSQQARPTILDPEAFLQVARATEGVESADFLVDGTLLVVVQGQAYRIRPNFQVESEATDPDAQPSVNVNPDGTLRYALPWADPNAPEESEEATTRRRGRAREALIFTPAVEPVPGEYCVLVQGKTRCDFQRIQ